MKHLQKITTDLQVQQPTVEKAWTIQNVLEATPGAAVLKNLPLMSVNDLATFES